MYTDGKSPSGEFMTHCHRELLHAQWKIILDAEFIHAYKHGIVILCCDSVQRRFYPRFFTYSADYMEKWVSSLATISCLHYTLTEFCLPVSEIEVCVHALAVASPCPACITLA
jgi:hypothetical protein